jgi:hypothetical protein
MEEITENAKNQKPYDGELVKVEKTENKSQQ